MAGKFVESALQDRQSVDIALQGLKSVDVAVVDDIRCEYRAEICQNGEPIATVISSEILSFPLLEQEAETYPDGGLKAYGVIIGSFLGLISNFGIMNSVGVFQTYISSHQLKDTDTSTTSWIFSIYLSLGFMLGVFSGPVFDSLGCRKLLIAGTILSLIGFMTASVSETVYQFILSFSICIGVSSALCIPPLVGVVGHWFMLKRGMATSLATLGGSVGGCVFPILFNYLYPKYGFGWAFRIIGFINFGCNLCSVILLKERFKRPFSSSTENDIMNKQKKFLVASKQLFDFKSLRDLKYSFLIVGVFLTELSLMSMVTYYASYAVVQGFSDSNAFILLTIFNAAGIPGRYLPGLLSDYIGYFNVMILMLIGFDLSMLLLWAPFGHATGVIWAFPILSGFFSSSILSLTPVCLGSICQTDKFGQRYGLLYSIVSIGYLFGIPMCGAVIGDESKARFQTFSILCGCIGLVGTIFWYASRYMIVGNKFNIKI